MTAPLDIQDAGSILRNHEERIAHLEGLFGRAGGSTAFDDEQIFNLASSLYAHESARWYPPATITVVSYIASLDTAGSTTSTIIVKRNGSTVKTISMTSGEQFEAGELVLAVNPEDYLQVEITVAGTGAVGLDVQLRYQHRVRS